jgi:hypothetical protein
MREAESLNCQSPSATNFMNHNTSREQNVLLYFNMDEFYRLTPAKIKF